ncbi:uncharacterized protein LOC122723884 [Manihot esculenta]|uniref:uncharacterized protein LOC122723884 n=1 Tax=Manihot esculenta TaxID=3983 RepID=UPI001CC524FF|nr:uncharacterized protein LOC122723884 [Manihot esculenta]
MLSDSTGVEAGPWICMSQIFVSNLAVVHCQVHPSSAAINGSPPSTVRRHQPSTTKLILNINIHGLTEIGTWFQPIGCSLPCSSNVHRHQKVRRHQRFAAIDSRQRSLFSASISTGSLKSELGSNLSAVHCPVHPTSTAIKSLTNLVVLPGHLPLQ